MTKKTTTKRKKKETQPPKEHKGRKPGTPNKTTIFARNTVNSILEKEMQQRFPEALDKLYKESLRDYVNAVIKMMALNIPKRVDLNLDGDEPKKIIQLTDKQFNEMNKILR